MTAYMKTPCPECPWRRDVPVGHFPAERFRTLAGTARDLATSIFACHLSKDEKPTACAGFVLMQGAHNLSLRLARQRFEVSTPVPLFRNYREMAVANGVAADDPALKCCRDDGQR